MLTKLNGSTFALTVDPNVSTWIALNLGERCEQRDRLDRVECVLTKTVEALVGRSDVQDEIFDSRVDGLTPADLGIGLFSGIEFDIVEVAIEGHFCIWSQSAINEPTAKRVGLGITQ
jgi:hypothetical protein